MRWNSQGARANRLRFSASAEDERWNSSFCKGRPKRTRQTGKRNDQNSNLPTM